MDAGVGRALAIAVGGAVALALASHLTSSPRALPSSTKPRALPHGAALPAGWRRYRGRITAAMRGAALTVLRQGRPIGSLVELYVDGRRMAALLEMHDDRRRGPHPGVSLLVPT